MTVIASTPTKSAKIHERLSYPVIDSDGHWHEYAPAVTEYLDQVMGKGMAGKYWAAIMSLRESDISFQERLKAKLPARAWWGAPTKNTLDRATAMLPHLMYQRMGDLGFDYSVLYPSFPGLTAAGYLKDDELRRGGCRALNMYTADLFQGYWDRLSPVAVIPNHTPQEAIEELEYCKERGFKAVVLAGLIERPLPPQAGQPGTWWETLGLDSEYDYDPVWAKCIELKLPPTFHCSGLPFGYRRSWSNYVYNHVGHFAAAGEAICKAIFLGGVTRRFPQLKFAFLEGGVAWACSLYSDLIRHWKVRNPQALENFNPANLDREFLYDLIEEHGNELMRGLIQNRNPGVEDKTGTLVRPEEIDDFSRCGIKRAEDIRDLFVPNFYFGCESEDPLNATAFNTRINPLGARFNILMGSDIGHFDVLEMTEVLEEAYELVEGGVLSEDNLRDFLFANAARFWTSLDPDFFKGTAVETKVARELAGT